MPPSIATVVREKEREREKKRGKKIEKEKKRGRRWGEGREIRKMKDR